jgi:hypothetical protein
MAQYESFGIKAGILTAFGTDTLRADLTTLGGMTTTTLVSGDACQVSGAMTVVPAVNTSAGQIVGIYDGVSGSVVRRGVVTASFVAGLTLVAGDAVYLAAVAGRLTNVKPTTGMLHEVGVVVSAAARTIMLQQKPVMVLPASTMLFDARSGWLLQGDAPPAYAGEQQPFPTTAAALIAALGATGVILPANVLAIYMCDTATPLVDSLGLGPNLVAAGGPLTGRECVGLPGTSFNSKVGVETLDASAMLFASAAVAFMDVPAGQIRSFLAVLRFNSNYVGPAAGRILSKSAEPSWQFSLDASVQLSLWAPGWATRAAVTADWTHGAWCSVAGIIDCVAGVMRLNTNLGNGVSAAFVGGCVNAVTMNLGADAVGQPAAPFQTAYLAFADVEITSAQRATFWRAFNLNAFSTPIAHTRAGPLITRISSGRVAAYGANQPAVGYNSNFTAGTDNTLETGVVCEDGASFLGLGTDNMGAWVGTNAAVTSVDGPSGMRDAIRVADTDGVNAGYATSGIAVPVGATNVPFVFECWVKSGGVGANAVFQSYLSGDAGGSELFTNWTIAGAVPGVWRPFPGLSFTPTRAAHTAAVVRLIPTDNVGASLGTVDFAEVWGVQNSNVARLTWRRVAAGAAAATATPVISIANVGNARYNPARGRIRLRFAGMPAAITGAEGLLSCGTHGAGGSMSLMRSMGSLTLAIYPDAGAPIIFNTAAIAVDAEHNLIIEWNAAAGTASISEGGVVIGSYAGAAWTPEPTDVTPIYLGSGLGGLTAARNWTAVVEFLDY